MLMKKGEMEKSWFVSSDKWVAGVLQTTTENNETENCNVKPFTLTFLSPACPLIFGWVNISIVFI